MKPIFTDKTKSAASITLKEKMNIVGNQNEFAYIFTDYVSKVVLRFNFQKQITLTRALRGCLVLH